GLRETLHLEDLPGVRREHEPHRGGPQGRALQPLQEDEGLRVAADAQRRGRRAAVIDSRDRFDAAADAYHRCRPSYPAALFDWLLATTGLGPGAAVADVGCGTGISTRLLAGRGLDVVGIDPSEPMLDRAREAGCARYQRGEAAATGLPDGS